MSTQFIAVAAGATSNPIFVTSMNNVIAGPSVLGGSVSVLFSPTLSLPQSAWLTVQTGTGGGSFRPMTTGYVVVTATTSQANVFVADLGPGLQAGGGVVVSINAPLASASTTSEVVLASWKIPPGYFAANQNFRMDVSGNVSLSNNANVKTLIVRANGLAGTAMATSPSIASALNYSFDTEISGRGDGVSLLGYGMLASQTSAQGGWGISTTANPTLSRDYIGQETEFVITATKATAGDTFQLENLRVTIA
jgi:hypothetical protein